MMCRLDWGGTCFASYGHYTSTAFTSKIDQIMSKYRPIAPKPTPAMTPNPCESISSNSNSSSALDSRSKFNTHRRNSSTESGRSGRNRRRASESRNSPSPRGQKRARAPPNNCSDSAFERGRILGSVPGSNRTSNGPKVIYPFHSSSSVEKFAVEKDPGSVKEAAANRLTERSALDEKPAGFGGFNIKEASNPSVEMVINPVKSMESLLVQRTPKVQHGFESGKYLVFPIICDSQQQEEEKNEYNLVTLPLLPETPSLKDSDVGSHATNSSCTVVEVDEETNNSNSSCNKEDFQFRLFGRDLSHKEVGPAQNESHESRQPASFVPVVQLPFPQHLI